MNTKFLGTFGVILALGCWSGLVTVRIRVFGEPLVPWLFLLELALVTVGAIIFWHWIATTLERQAAEVRQRTRHLEALHAASIALTTEHELTIVLQKVIDLSRVLLNAKYGALGIIGEDGETIDQMITSGLTPAARAQINRFPHGDGLLGAPIHERRSVRVDAIPNDTRARGFPPNHPTMHSFLGVPIMSKGRMFGNLYLADKLPSSDQDELLARGGHSRGFTQEDQELLEMFANQAAIAIENAQLYRQNQQLAIYHERERFGMDLHDGVVQSIYAVGLMLDDSRHRMADDPKGARATIDTAITGLNRVITDIRSYIHDLRTHQFQGRNLQQGLEELVRDLQTYSVLNIDMEIDPGALARISPPATQDLLQIAREALSNIRKHAHATQIRIRLARTPNGITLTIADNGVGLAADDPTNGGHGLHNMCERATNLNGHLQLHAIPSGGTQVELTIPT